jgi:hypothetical protein
LYHKARLKRQFSRVFMPDCGLFIHRLSLELEITVDEIQRGEPMVPHEPLLLSSELEITIHEIVLLQAPEALTDLASAHRADPVDRFEVAMACPNHGVQ